MCCFCDIRHRGGYPEGDLTLYHTLQASDFVKSDNFLELLSGSNQVVLDDERIASHPATTVEIKECLKDIKLLGKNEIKCAFSDLFVFHTN